MENCKTRIKLESPDMKCIEVGITCIESCMCNNKQALWDMRCNIDCLEISSNQLCNWYNVWHSCTFHIKIDMLDTFLYCFKHRFLVDSLWNKSYYWESILENIMYSFWDHWNYMFCINQHKFCSTLKYYGILQDTN